MFLNKIVKNKNKRTHSLERFLLNFSIYKKMIKFFKSLIKKILKLIQNFVEFGCLSKYIFKMSCLWAKILIGICNSNCGHNNQNQIRPTWNGSIINLYFKGLEIFLKFWITMKKNFHFWWDQSFPWNSKKKNHKF